VTEQKRQCQSGRWQQLRLKQSSLGQIDRDAVMNDMCTKRAPEGVRYASTYRWRPWHLTGGKKKGGEKDNARRNNRALLLRVRRIRSCPPQQVHGRCYPAHAKRLAPQATGISMAMPSWRYRPRPSLTISKKKGKGKRRIAALLVQTEARLYTPPIWGLFQGPRGGLKTHL
jgi:hypothetical protein